MIPDSTRRAIAKYRKTPKGVYVTHKKNAKTRGIAFLLSFEQWWTIWQASGRFEQRGSSPGKYCMCRMNDSGPYAVGNVRIDLWNHNNAERNKTVTPKHQKIVSPWANRHWPVDPQADDAPF